MEWLRTASKAIDAWETTEMLMLEGKDAVLQWMKGTALRPFLTAVTPVDAEIFQVELAKRLNEVYPPGSDGKTLYPFTRRYFVAIRKADSASAG